MTLAKKEIIEAIRKKEIVITPFEEKNVGACSLDLRLGRTFKLLGSAGMIKVEENAKYPPEKTKTITLKGKETLKLKPMQFVLGATLEKIKMGEKHCAFIEGRSRFARLGLMVHISSGLVQPGVENVQVLEIVNLSPSTLELKPGTRICQLVFDKLSSRGKYEGKFRKQVAP